MRAIWEFIGFWIDCILRGWTTGKFVFAATEAILLFAWLRYSVKNRAEVLKPLEEKLKGFSKYLFFALFVFSTVFLAPFLKYRSVSNTKEIAEKALKDKSPKLEGFVHRTFIGNDGANSLIFLDVSVDNSGGTPSIAEEYRLSIILPDHSFTNAKAINIPEEYKLNFPYKDKLWLLDLKRPQLISEKTSKSIQNGDHPRGWAAFKLSEMKGFDSTNIVLSFSDWTGAKTFVTNGFWRGKLGGLADVDLTTVVPGAENIFYPIEPPARTNWLPPELPPGCSNVVIYLGTHGLVTGRKIAEITSSGTKFSISELPDFLLTDLDKMPDYSPRQREMWVRVQSSKYTIGDRTIDYPLQPVVISNRLYVEVEIPFSNERRKLLMSDAFSSELPIPRDWDVNFSTNYDAYGNGIYAFEVVNELRNPVLQVAYAAPNEVHVNGIFQVDSNSILAAFGDQPLLGTFRFDNLTNQEMRTASLRMENFYETLFVKSNETIASFGQRLTNEFFKPIFKNQKPMFKYPSNRHPGEFADDVLLR